jgi:hypothetical protein
MCFHLKYHVFEVDFALIKKIIIKWFWGFKKDVSNYTHLVQHVSAFFYTTQAFTFYKSHLRLNPWIGNNKFIYSIIFYIKLLFFPHSPHPHFLCVFVTKGGLNEAKEFPPFKFMHFNVFWSNWARVNDLERINFPLLKMFLHGLVWICTTSKCKSFTLALQFFCTYTSKVYGIIGCKCKRIKVYTSTTLVFGGSLPCYISSRSRFVERCRKSNNLEFWGFEKCSKKSWSFMRVPTNIRRFRVGSLTSSLILLEPWLQVNIGYFVFIR